MVIDATRDAVAAATRSNVAIYGIDPRGLTDLGDESIEIQAYPDDTTVGVGPGSLQNELRLAQDSLRVLSDGRTLASASSDYTVKLWRVSDGMLLHELQGFNPVAFSPDGQTVATGAYGNVMQLFRVSDGAPLYRLTGHSSGVESVAFSPDGQTLVTGSKDIEVRRWHVSDGVRLYTLEENGEGVSFVTFSTDGRMMAVVYKDGTVKLWQVP